MKSQLEEYFRKFIVNSNLHRPNETVEALVRDRFFCALVLPEAYRQILRARLFGSGMMISLSRDAEGGDDE